MVKSQQLQNIQTKGKELLTDQLEIQEKSHTRSAQKEEKDLRKQKYNVSYTSKRQETKTL